MNRSVQLCTIVSVLAVCHLLTTRLAAQDCAYALSPVSATLSANNATGLVALATTPDCAWSVINTSSWISVTAGASGTGSGLVRYVAAANPSPSARIGAMVIGGQVYTVTQVGSPCAFALSPTNRVHSSSGEMGTVNVLTMSGCSWVALNTNAWISILSSTNGVGSGVLSYGIAANPSAQDRSGSIQVAGQPFHISQLGNSGPSITTQPSSQTVVAGGTTTFTVAVSGVPAPVTYQWRFNGLNLSNGAGVQGVTTSTLTLTSVQQGHAGVYSVVVSYAGGTLVSSDATLTVTTGVISLAEALDVEALIVTTVGTPPWNGQTGVSHDGVDAAATGAVADSGAVTIQSVMTGPGTVSFWWKVSSEAGKDYLKFFIDGVEQVRISGEVNWEQRSATLSSGSHTLKWTYAKNASLSAGLDRAWVDQIQFSGLPGGCTFAVSPASVSAPQNSSTGLVTVTTSAGCAWNVFNSNSWITVLSGGSGTESGTVSYQVSGNPGGVSRTGNLLIAGQLVTVTQAGAPCTVAISPSGQIHGGGQEEGTIAVTTLNGCAWTVLNTNSWVTILSSPNNSSGTITYRVSANLTSASRNGFLAIDGQHFSIEQAAETNPSPVPSGQAFETLYSFQGADGSTPFSRLVQGNDGDLYGTTAAGGTDDKGTVFRLTTNGTLTTLFSFHGADGATPYAGLIQGSDGHFYGVTYYGGASNLGTVFRLTTNGTLTSLHSFQGGDGRGPTAGLVQGNDGHFYGTTVQGGAHDEGTIFRISTSEVLTVLVSFDGTNGATPSTELVLGTDGLFYGTTRGGGAHYSGTAFKMTINGTLTTLAELDGSNGEEMSGLTLGRDGLFYGTAEVGGARDWGTVFRMTAHGAMTTVTSFDGSNGGQPSGSVLLGTDGFFYGTASEGGAHGNGTVFQVTSTGALAVFMFFNGTNGSYPEAGLMQGRDGHFYGTTSDGGPNGSRHGTIFRILMPVLEFQAAAGKLVLSWPTNMSGLTLQSSVITSGLPEWIDSTQEPVVVGGRFTMTNGMSGSASLFRLRKP